MITRIQIILLVLFLCGCYSRQPSAKTGLEGQPVPSIALLQADSTTIFTTDSIRQGRPFLVMAFEPWCPYCRAQTAAIVKDIAELQDMDFYLLCSGRVTEFRKYYEEYGLGKYSNIHAGIDRSRTFARYFESNQVPYLAFYDKEKKLKEVVVGKTTIARIRDILLD